MELIQLDLIDPNPYQPRQTYDQEGIESLARGIKIKREKLPDTLGLMQVPMARQVDGRYQLAFGHRRCEAFKHNFRVEVTASEWAKMPLVIVDLTDEEMYDFAARENGDREDINPIEKARSILEAQEKFGWNLQRAASAHGLSKSAASNLTRLLQLPVTLQNWLVMGDLSQRHARELVRLVQCDESLTVKCVDLGRQCLEEEMTVNDLKIEIDEVIREFTNRQKVAEHISGQMCPHCDAPVAMHDGKGFSFGCGVHNWTSLVEFNIDWSQRKHREAEERKDEKLRQETRTVYCPKCNHPQDFNGYDVEHGKYAKCESCNTGHILFAWRKEPYSVTYRPLNLDGPGDDPDGDDIETTAAPACPWWTKITGTAETCYICGRHAEWHNNGDLNQAGANLHLCKEHYFGNLSNVNAHSTEAQLRGILDRIKAMEDAEKEKEAKEAEEVQYAVYPCHVCGEQKIVIDPVANYVRCDACGEFWDLASEYHSEREYYDKKAVDDDVVFSENVSPDPGDEIEIAVSKEMLVSASSLYSAVELQKDRARGIFSMDGDSWVCYAYVGQGNDILEVNLVEAISPDAWPNPTCQYKELESGTHYAGQKIKVKGQEHVLTGRKITLVPETEAKQDNEIDINSPEFEAGLRRALHHYADADQRWQERKETGLTDAQLKEAISFEFGISGSSGGPGIPDIAFKGGSDPKFVYGSMDYYSEPTLGGRKLVDKVRQVMVIPYPIGVAEAAVLNPIVTTDEKCSDCGKPGIAEAAVTDDLKLDLTLNPINGDGEPEYYRLDIGLKPAEVSPEVERQSLMIDVNNRWLALIRRADINQIREMDAALDDLEQAVFPENTLEQETEPESEEELPEYVPDYLQELNQWKR